MSSSLLSYAWHYVVLRTLYDGARAAGARPAVLVAVAGAVGLLLWLGRRRRRTHYRAYLRSPAWGRKREAVHGRSGGLCERCGTPIGHGGDVHHRTYAHLGRERLGELEHLCRRCHERVHA